MSKAPVVVEVQGLAKKYCRSLRRSLFYASVDIATELAGRRRHSDALRRGEFWALNDVSFELRQGESLGLVGANGSGKTTLLRVIGGVIKPDAGSVRVRGTVAPLIALGAGFNPVLTGRENVYANMAVLGLTRRQIDDRYDSVIDFAQIGDAVDAPVRTYSSGMAARLGFACAVHVDPDVFLIDEVLAVGDISFRNKCYRKLAELRDRGTSFILVSHNPHSILSICESALYLSDGRRRGLGEASKILTAYQEDLTHRSEEFPAGNLRRPARSREESSGLDVTEIGFRGRDGKPMTVLKCGDPVIFYLRLEAYEDFPDLNVTLMFRERMGEGEWLLRLSTLADAQLFSVGAGVHELLLTLPYCGFKPGSYCMKLSVTQGLSYVLDAVEAFHFRVESAIDMTQCDFYQPREWKLLALERVTEK